MWEKIDKKTDRMRVPNGWIIRSYVTYSIQMLFIEDKEHLWVLQH